MRSTPHPRARILSSEPRSSLAHPGLRLLRVLLSILTTAIMILVAVWESISLPSGAVKARSETTSE
jgi:hypothetical protein